MNNDRSYLVTFWNGEFLVALAIKIPGARMNADERIAFRYFNEPKSKDIIKSFFPDGTFSKGDVIVNCEDIHGVYLSSGVYLPQEGRNHL